MLRTSTSSSGSARPYKASRDRDLLTMCAPHTLPADVLALCEYYQVFRMNYLVASKEEPNADFRIYRILLPPF